MPMTKLMMMLCGDNNEAVTGPLLMTRQRSVYRTLIHVTLSHFLVMFRFFADNFTYMTFCCCHISLFVSVLYIFRVRSSRFIVTELCVFVL